MTSTPVPTDAPDPRRWIALGVVLCASFMVLLDISIVNVAIPSIQRDLGARYGQIQFIIAGYQLAYAVVLITGGRLGDIAGRKRMFMTGMTGFVLASALCGAAQSPNMLIASRVIQGLAASLMYPQVLSVIQVSFSGKERGKAFGIFGAIVGLATIAGPLIGGLLIQANLFGWDWRPIFLVNVPVGIAALTAAFFLLQESRAPHAPKLDIPGVLLISAGLFLLTFPLVEGRDAGWPTWAFVSLAASPFFIAFFVWYEARRSKRSLFPLVELSLFRDRAFSAGLAMSFVFFAGVPALFLTLSLFLQIGLGFSPLHAGLTTIPFSVTSAMASAASVRLAPRLGKNILSIGSVTIALGIALTIGTIHLFGTQVTGPELIPALAIGGIGLGSFVAPAATTILASIRGKDAGSASGVLTTAQQVGGAVGVAVIGVLFFGLLGSHVDGVAQYESGSLQSQLVALQIPQPAINGIITQFKQCAHDRATEADPTAVPQSCQPSAGESFSRPTSSVAAALITAGNDVRELDFAQSFERAVIACIVVFLAAFVCVFFLPNPKHGKR